MTEREIKPLIIGAGKVAAAAAAVVAAVPGHNVVTKLSDGTPITRSQLDKVIAAFRDTGKEIDDAEAVRFLSYMNEKMKAEQAGDSKRVAALKAAVHELNERVPPDTPAYVPMLGNRRYRRAQERKQRLELKRLCRK